MNMKKLLLSLISVLCVLTANAQTKVTFDFTDPESLGFEKPESSKSTDISDGGTITKDNVTITCKQNGASTATRFWGGTSYVDFRAYNKATLTITAPSGSTITSLTFDGSKIGVFSFDNGTYTSPTWTGNANPVVITLTGTCNIKSLEVTYASSDAKVIGVPTITPATGTYIESQSVTITAAEGYGVIYTTDGTTPADGNGTYEKSGSAKITISETTTVKAISVDNADPDNTSSVTSSTITISKNYNTAETALTVGEALKFIAEGKNLDDNVYTKGKICKIDELSTDFGNATYFITDGKDTLEVYRGFGIDGAKFTATDEIGKGDVVVVFGKLVDYKGTYEYTTGSQIISIDKTGREEDSKEQDKPEVPYELVGAGTLANPYTVEDIVKKIYVEGETVTGVWVKGVIRGCVTTTAGNKISDKEPVNSNIGISTSADSETIIPVQLPYVKENDGALRAAINILDNATNVGKTIYIYGDISKYCGVAGLKNPSDYSWDGITSSVLSVEADINSKAVRYSISGQKVDASYKGITVQKGKKTLVK